MKRFISSLSLLFLSAIHGYAFDTTGLTLAHTVTDTKQSVLLQVYNRPNNGGYYIVTEVPGARSEVLAQIEHGSFDPATADKRMMTIIDNYAQGLANLLSNPQLQEQASEFAAQSAKRLKAAPIKSVGPLLGDIAWGQGAPYDLYTQVIDGEQCPTGCTATATTQVMRYWKYPEVGMGSNSYENASETLTADFNHPYNWELMLLNYREAESTEEQRQAVARLMSDVGIAFSMHYQPHESGAEFNPRVMHENFGYDAGIRFISANYCSTEDWERLLRTEFDAGRPVICDGGSSHGAHCFVCDGYDAEGRFHYNFGWDGDGNGYFMSNATGYDLSPDFYYGIQPDKGNGYALSPYVYSDFVWVEGMTVSGIIHMRTFGDVLNPETALRVTDADGDNERYICYVDGKYFELSYDLSSELPALGLPDGQYKITPVVRVNGGEWEVPMHHPYYQLEVDFTLSDGHYTFTNTNVEGPLDEGKVEKDGVYYILNEETQTASVTFRNMKKKSYSGAVTVPEYVNIDGTEYAVTAIGESAFESSTITNVTIGANVQVIGNGAFSESSELISVTFAPGSCLEVIDGWGFNGCTSLPTITLPSTVRILGMCAFTSCHALTEIDLPVGLISNADPSGQHYIGNYAFDACENLTKMHVHWAHPMAQPWLINTPENITLYVPQGTASAYTALDCWNRMTIVEDPTDVLASRPAAEGLELIDGVYYRLDDDSSTATVEAKNAYTSGYSGSVTIPATVNKAGTTYTVTRIAEGAMMYSEGLTSVNIQAQLEAIGSYAFAECSALQEITFAEDGTVSIIDWYAFLNCASLSSIKLPKGCNYVGFYAFEGCTSLTTADIAATAFSLSPEMFKDCSNLERIIVHWQNPIPLGYGTEFSGFDASSVTLQVPTGAAEGYQAKEGWNIFGHYEEADDLEVEEGGGDGGDDPVIGPTEAVQIDGLWYMLFDEYQEANIAPCPIGKYTGNIIIPATVSYNGHEYNVYSVGSEAMKDCTGLTSITIEKQGLYFFYNAFEGCTGLTSIAFANGGYIGSIYDNALKGCSSLTSLFLPEGCYSICDTALEGCTALTTLDIPLSVDTNEAFYFGQNIVKNCPNLKRVIVHWQEPNALYDGVFSACDLSGTTLVVPEGTIDMYRILEGWNQFGHIEEFVSVQGDVSGDGVFDAADAVALAAILTGKAPMPVDISNIDLDGNDEITVGDLTRLIQMLQ